MRIRNWQHIPGKNNKLAIVAVFGALFFGVGFPAEAQQPAKIPRIAFLFFGSKQQPHLESFRQGLRELGYVEGKNLDIEYRYAEGDSAALPGLAAELVALNPAVILTTIPQASRAVIRTTRLIPIVVVGAGDPVREGLAKSLAHPGGNLTGLSSSAAPGMVGKQLELLKGSVPKMRIVTMLWTPLAGRFADVALEEARSAAPVLGLQLRFHELRNTTDVDQAFVDLENQRADGLLIPGGPIVTQNSRRIAKLAADRRLPTISNSRQFVDDGGLMTYGVNFADLYRRAATYVDKILKGTKVADLPIEQPMKFEFVVNLKAAKAIGLTISPNVLARADRVIR